MASPRVMGVTRAEVPDDEPPPVSRRYALPSSLSKRDFLSPEMSPSGVRETGSPRIVALRPVSPPRRARARAAAASGAGAAVRAAKQDDSMWQRCEQVVYGGFPGGRKKVWILSPVRVTIPGAQQAQARSQDRGVSKE